MPLRSQWERVLDLGVGLERWERSDAMRWVLG